MEKSNEFIAERERNYREIFNASTDAIFVHDLEGKIIDVNNAMLSMYGYNQDELQYMNINDLSEGKAPYDFEYAKEFF